MHIRSHHVFMGEAGEGSTGGGAVGAGPAGVAAGAGAGEAGAAGTDASAAGAGAAPGSVLATGAAAPSGGAAAQGAGATPGPNDWLDKKFHVVKEDGTLDIEASARKVGESQRQLEARLGSAGGLPPKTADEYKINVPADLAEKIKAEDLSKDAGFKDFIGKLHGAGLNQAQVDVAVGEFLDRSMKLQGAMAQLSADETTAALKDVWKTDAEYQQNLNAAYRAGTAYGDIEKLLAKYGNDPDFIQFAAKVGKELAEDTGTPNGGQKLAEADVEALQKSKAYWDPNDLQHAAVKAKVAAHYNAIHGDRPKQTGSMSFQSAV